MAHLFLGKVLQDDEGNRYVVRGFFDVTYFGQSDRAIGLTLIPEGMSAEDLGRRFKATRGSTDYELIMPEIMVES